VCGVLVVQTKEQAKRLDYMARAMREAEQEALAKYHQAEVRTLGTLVVHNIDPVSHAWLHTRVAYVDHKAVVV
jgi:hypothetical protein